MATALSGEESSGEEVSLDLLVQSQAQLLLDSLGHVQSPAGVVGPLHAKDVGGGGWCFFRAFVDQLGSDVVRGFRVLAAFALAETAKRRLDFAHSVAGSLYELAEPLEVQDGRRALKRAWRGYAGVADALGPFEVGVLDKFEGVIAGDLSDERRYADMHEMLALVQACDMQLLLVEGADVPGAALRTKVYPSDANLDAAAPMLRSGGLDMVFVRYEATAWMHYRSVSFADGRPWRVGEGLRRRVEARVAACPVCEALGRRDIGLARALMLSLLDPAASLLA